MIRAFTITAACVALLMIGGVSRAVPVSRALRAPLPDVKLDSVSLSDAIDYVRDVSAANIVVNWKALEEAGVSKDTPVSVRLRGVPLRRVLDVMLSEAGGTTALSYTYDQDVLEITTKELADKKLFTRLYPVEDLIMEVPDFNDAPNFDLNQATNQSSGGGGGGQSIFGGNGSSNNSQNTTTRAERGEQLVTLIESLIEPDIWNTNGGPASIRFFNGSLIVTAPQSVHEALSVVND